MHVDYCIVGAGLSAATIAEHAARDGCSVVVVEQRDHIAGNCFDKIDSETGIRVSQYGAHLFHTNDKEVWDYLQQFGEWARWEHKVLADCDGVLVPVPANPTTVNLLFGENISNEAEMEEWRKRECVIDGKIENSRDVAISRVGPRLYNRLFEGYTRKQWAKDASELEPSVLARIPLRNSFDDRYFGDKFQALPKNGYTAIVEAMLQHPHIKVLLNTCWDSNFTKASGYTWDKLIFTGPIDQYFAGAGLPKLEYRSLNFEWHRLPIAGFFQPNSVINYPSPDTRYTRCVEYKHFLHQKSDWTVLSLETSCDDGDPYYPVPTPRNRELYSKYQKLSEAEDKTVHFVGRLASYKYFNMDQAVRNAIDYYRQHLKP